MGDQLKRWIGMAYDPAPIDTPLVTIDLQSFSEDGARARFEGACVAQGLRPAGLYQVPRWSTDAMVEALAGEWVAQLDDDTLGTPAGDRRLAAAIAAASRGGLRRIEGPENRRA